MGYKGQLMNPIMADSSQFTTDNSNLPWKLKIVRGIKGKISKKMT